MTGVGEKERGSRKWNELWGKIGQQNPSCQDVPISDGGKRFQRPSNILFDYPKATRHLSIYGAYHRGNGKIPSHSRDAEMCPREGALTMLFS